MEAVAHDEPTVEVERHAVRTGGTLADYRQLAAVEVEAVDIGIGGEEQVPVRMPDGAFREAVACGQRVRIEVFEDLFESVGHGLFPR